MLPDLDTCKEVRDALLIESIPEEAIQFIAKSGTTLEGLNTASNIDSTNMLHEGEKGIAYGMVFGLISGLYVITFPLWITVSPAWYSDAPWFVILGTLILIGGLMMAIGAALLGMNIFNSDLKQYKSKIEKGEILMILSVPIRHAHKMRLTIQSSLLNSKAKTLLLNQIKV
jgi:hypothetical protein